MSTQTKPQEAKKTNPNAKRHALMMVLAVFAVFTIGVAPAAAAGEVNGTIDWTALGEMITGAGQMMPSISSLIIAVVPILILLIIVGFITGLFDAIIGAVRDAMRMINR